MWRIGIAREDVIGKEVGSLFRQREVHCPAARDMCVLSSLVPGVATVSTSPHYTACYSALDVRHSLDLGCNVGPPSTKQG